MSKPRVEFVSETSSNESSFSKESCHEKLTLEMLAFARRIERKSTNNYDLKLRDMIHLTPYDISTNYGYRTDTVKRIEKMIE